MSDPFRLYRLYSDRLPHPWDFSGKNTGVGCHFLLQGIFLTQGWNLSLLCLLHWQTDSSLSHPGSPRTWGTPQIELPLVYISQMTNQAGCWKFIILQGIFIQKYARSVFPGRLENLISSDWWWNSLRKWLSLTWWKVTHSPSWWLELAMSSPV